ncbi:hypothetical protein [Microbacterium sp. 13-71-7]|uniref:hypothetical protein n=1 Tax=Microbacterium sp. 13-71-7 TaxID=1970399 RepID=UPI000BC97233|nr:hypothetical protein [Microbacterium sp. 13-71-7]OZB84320.1 MAG: hypothetical protein B7X32_07505 [Microbacterium sp. 13-71-7]
MSIMDPAPGAPRADGSDWDREVSRHWHPYVPSVETKARMDALANRSGKPVPIPSFPPLPG